MSEKGWAAAKEIREIVRQREVELADPYSPEMVVLARQLVGVLEAHHQKPIWHPHHDLALRTPPEDR